MNENKTGSLNEKVRKAIEAILTEMSPQPEESTERPSDYEEFESEQKRFLKD